MKPIEFPEQTIVWAQDQPLYLPTKTLMHPRSLPAYTDETETISLWRLSWRERLRVLLTGRLWLRQLNFGQALQPQKPEAQSPFSRVRAGTDHE